MTNIGISHILNTLQDTTLNTLYGELLDAEGEMRDALDKAPAGGARDELAKDADEMRRFIVLVKKARTARRERKLPL